jgi:hypothetical protein
MKRRHESDRSVLTGKLMDAVLCMKDTEVDYQTIRVVLDDSDKEVIAILINSESPNYATIKKTLDRI